MMQAKSRCALSAIARPPASQNRRNVSTTGDRGPSPTEAGDRPTAGRTPAPPETRLSSTGTPPPGRRPPPARPAPGPPRRPQPRRLMRQGRTRGGAGALRRRPPCSRRRPSPRRSRTSSARVPPHEPSERCGRRWHCAVSAGRLIRPDLPAVGRKQRRGGRRTRGHRRNDAAGGGRAPAVQPYQPAG